MLLSKFTTLLDILLYYTIALLSMHLVQRSTSFLIPFHYNKMIVLDLTPFLHCLFHFIIRELSTRCNFVSTNSLVVPGVLIDLLHDLNTHYYRWSPKACIFHTRPPFHPLVNCALVQRVTATQKCNFSKMLLILTPSNHKNHITGLSPSSVHCINVKRVTKLSLGLS